MTRDGPSVAPAFSMNRSPPDRNARMRSDVDGKRATLGREKRSRRPSTSTETAPGECGLPPAQTRKGPKLANDARYVMESCAPAASTRKRMSEPGLSDSQPDRRPRSSRGVEPVLSRQLTRTVNGTGHTGTSEFCATSI